MNDAQQKGSYVTDFCHCAKIKWWSLQNFSQIMIDSLCRCLAFSQKLSGFWKLYNEIQYNAGIENLITTTGGNVLLETLDIIRSHQIENLGYTNGAMEVRTLIWPAHPPE